MARTKGAINRAPSKAEREKSAVVDAKQKVFADAVLEGHSQSDAARAAGYHPASAASAMKSERRSRSSLPPSFSAMRSCSSPGKTRVVSAS